MQAGGVDAVAGNRRQTQRTGDLLQVVGERVVLVAKAARETGYEVHTGVHTRGQVIDGDQGCIGHQQ